MKTEEKLALMEEIMDVDEGCLSENSSLEEFDEWDSLSKLSLIAAAKKHFNKSLTTETIRGFKIVKDICNYLS